MKTSALSAQIYCFLIFVFLFSPTLAIVVFSFESSGSGTLPFAGFTLNWYQDIFSQIVVIKAFRSSIFVALLTMVLAVSVGTLASYGLFKRRTKMGQAIITTAMLPLAIPYLVLGVSLLSIFRFTGIALSLVTVAIGHLLISLPIVLVTVNAQFASFDPAVEEAARDLGASGWKAFKTITFPMIRPSVMGAGLLVFAISLDEFVVSLFTIGAQSTVPIVVWGQMRRGVSPSVNAISTLLLLVTAGLVLLARKFSGAQMGSKDLVVVD